MSLGNKIRDLRIAKGLTQADLGAGIVTPSMISQIESGKGNPSYKVLEAIAAKLETPLDYFVDNIQTQLEKSTVHKVGQALIAAENYEKAVVLLESLGVENPPDIDCFALYFNLGECYLHLDRYEEALARFEQACKIAEQSRGKPHEVIRALNKMGIVEMQRHKYHSASFYWKCALKRFEELPIQEPFIQSEVLMNLGKLHSGIGEVQEAVTYFHMAFELLSRTNKMEPLGFLYLELAASYEKLRDFRRSSEYSQYARAVFESLKNIKTSIHAKKQYGIVKGEVGELAEAYSILQECLKEYEDCNDLTEVAVVHGEIAKLYIGEMKFVDAKLECKAGLTKIAQDRPEAATLLRYVAKAEDSLGRSEESIRYLEQALAIYRAHDLYTDVTDVYSLLGEMHEKTGNLVRANECLQNMKKSMEDSLIERGIAW